MYLHEAHSGRSVFDASADKCRCYVEALLELPRRPVPIASATASTASASGLQHAEQSVAKTNDGLVAGSLIHGIASRLRARSATGVKYRDNDNEDSDDAAENCEESSDTERDLACVDDDEDEFKVHDKKRTSASAEEKYSGAVSGLDALSHKPKESLDVRNDETYDDDLDSSSSDSDADDADWNPKKPLYGNRMKRTKHSAYLRFKLKTDPALDDELNAIRNDGTGGDGTGEREAKSTVGIKRSHKRSLAPKSLKSKLRHMSHKKARDVKNKIRSIRSKDGPKWEKKVSIFTEYICLHNNV